MKEPQSILIVEDNSDHLELTKLALKKALENILIKEASCGAECMQIISNSDFDLVILDYSLPDQNGIEVLESIRNLKPELPILMVTGQGNERLAVQAMKKGANDYFIKSPGYLTTLPVTVSRLFKENEKKSRLDTMEIEKQLDTLEIQRINEKLVEKNKKLQELNKIKTQFVSNIGHELRTPLNGILGYTELLKDGIYGDINKTQSDALQNIMTSGTHLLNLINELLDFAKIQSGKFKIYKEISSAYSIVNAAISTVKPSLEEKGIRLLCSFEDNLPQFYVDSQKIYQVLLNILSNAVKFTSDGEIEVKIFKKKKHIQFEVRDTGIGMSKHEINEIFQDFRQLDGSFTRNHGGTGLGLSLAKYLIELHGGEINAESCPNKGSHFFFKLPIEDHEVNS